MNAAAIFGILEKGLSLLPVLISTGTSVVSIIQRMTKVAAAAKEGKTVDKAEIDALEAELDTALAEFNAPLPPE